MPCCTFIACASKQMEMKLLHIFQRLDGSYCFIFGFYSFVCFHLFTASRPFCYCCQQFFSFINHQLQRCTTSSLACSKICWFAICCFQVALFLTFSRRPFSALNLQLDLLFDLQLDLQLDISTVRFAVRYIYSLLVFNLFSSGCFLKFLWTFLPNKIALAPNLPGPRQIYQERTNVHFNNSYRDSWKVVQCQVDTLSSFGK